MGFEQRKMVLRTNRVTYRQQKSEEQKETTMGEMKTEIGGNSLDEGQSLACAVVSTEDLQSPHNLDVIELKESAMGRLLDSIPMPALLVDPLLSIALANRACHRLGHQPENLQGRFLSALFSGQSVVTKIQRLTGDVLAGRSQAVDAKLEITGRKVWSRLYFQSVVLGRDKWMVMLVKEPEP